MSFPTFSFKPSKSTERKSNEHRNEDKRSTNSSKRSRSRSERSSFKDHPWSRSGGSERKFHKPNRFGVLQDGSEEVDRRGELLRATDSRSSHRLYVVDTKGDSLNEQMGYHHPSSTPQYKRYTSYILGDKIRRVRNVIGDDGHVFLLDGPEMDYSPDVSLSAEPLNLFTRCFSDQDILGDIVSLNDLQEDDTARLVISELLKKRVELQQKLAKHGSELETWVDLLAVEQQLQVEQKCPDDQSAEIILPLISDCLSNLSQISNKNNVTIIKHSVLPHKIRELDLVVKDPTQGNAGFFDSVTWKNMALSHPFVAELWENWIDSYVREHGPRDKEKLGYLQAFVDLQRKECLSQLFNERASKIIANGGEDGLRYVFARIVAKITSLMRDAGYFEFAISLTQLLIERNFFGLQNVSQNALMEFWESEAPRFGDKGAEGWPTTKGIPESGDAIVPRSIWPEFENFQSLAGSGVDAFSVVFFDDISEYITVEGQHFNPYLLLIFFNLLGCNIGSLGACITHLNLDDYASYSMFVDCALSQLINMLPSLKDEPAHMSSVLLAVRCILVFFAQNKFQKKIHEFYDLIERAVLSKMKDCSTSWEISALLTEVRMYLGLSLTDDWYQESSAEEFHGDAHWQNVKLRVDAKAVVHDHRSVDETLCVLKQALNLLSLADTHSDISVPSALDYLLINLKCVCNFLEYETIVALIELIVNYAEKTQCNLVTIRHILRQLGNVFYESVEIQSRIVQFQGSHGLVYDDLKEKHVEAYFAAYYLEHGTVSPEIYRYLLKNYRLPGDLFLVSMASQSVKRVLRYHLCYKANIKYLDNLAEIYKKLGQPERIKDLQRGMDQMLIRWRLLPAFKEK